jgi:hypothetical protein
MLPVMFDAEGVAPDKVFRQLFHCSVDTLGLAF